MIKRTQLLSLALLIGLFFGCAPNSANSHQHATTEAPLPSWIEGQSKTSIINFVDGVSNSKLESFIPEGERIAVFDNDGTLWAEQPAYFQLFFTMDRIREMAKDHPEWKDMQPYKAILENDMEALTATGEHGLVKLVLSTHAGSTTEEFESIVSHWIQTAKHPTKKIAYDKLVYQPMLELLQYLRDNGFKTYIVSGGGVDFMRAIVTEVYGIPSEQIIGSTIKTEFDLNDGHPAIKRSSELDFINDKEGKPINIHKIIGKKPIFCAGNSDGDLAMMQWTASNPKGSFMLYVHHTDSAREWAYDINSNFGRLNRGLY